MTDARTASAVPAQSRAAVTSLHERILSDIEARILSGEWAPGARIPFEHELSAQYDCSRMTVNKALTELAKSGLIERRRKVGSFVMRAQSRSAALEILDIRSEVAALGEPYRYELLNRRSRRATRSDQALLQRVGGGAMLDLACRHWAGERPFCLEERLISLSAAPEAAEESFAETAPGPWLLARAPWTTAEHRIRARAADARRAALLDIGEGDACLVIERRTWSGDMAVTHVTLTYPGGGHELVARFSPTRR
jgi:GntR family histidine utilization transcriptional repressor